MMQWFVTATDTGAGKTFVVLNILQEGQRRKIDMKAIKPLACGMNQGDTNEDVALLASAQNQPPSQIVFQTLTKPCAPLFAAQAENKQVDPASLIKWCHLQAGQAEHCLIEGVGGLMVPIAENFLVLDWISAMENTQIILVVRSHLGGINHALLSIEALRQAGRQPYMILLNDADHCGEDMIHMHQASIEAKYPGIPVIAVPHHSIEDKNQQVDAFASVVDQMEDAVKTGQPTSSRIQASTEQKT